jgi:hypothetical protein
MYFIRSSNQNLSFTRKFPNVQYKNKVKFYKRLFEIFFNKVWVYTQRIFHRRHHSSHVIWQWIQVSNAIKQPYCTVNLI